MNHYEPIESYDLIWII